MPCAPPMPPRANAVVERPTQRAMQKTESFFMSRLLVGAGRRAALKDFDRADSRHRRGRDHPRVAAILRIVAWAQVVEDTSLTIRAAPPNRGNGRWRSGPQHQTRTSQVSREDWT